MSISDDMYLEGTSSDGNVNFSIIRVNGRFLIDYLSIGSNCAIKSVVSKNQNINDVLDEAKSYKYC